MHEREGARLRSAYADILDAEDDPDLVRFVGALEAIHAAPVPPRLLTAPTPTTPDGRAIRRLWPLPTASPHGDGRAAAERPVEGRRRWRTLVRGANAAVAAALLVAFLIGATLLLRGGARSATSGDAVAQPVALPDLVYPGMFEGRTGLVAARADGSRQWLLDEGNYQYVAWAPDGRRFLANGWADNQGAKPTSTVVLFSTEGRVLRRYALGAVQPLVAHWAPDSRHVALLVRSGTVVDGEDSGVGTWLLDEDGARELKLGARTFVGTTTGMGAWSASGRLAVEVIPRDTNGDGRITRAGDTPELWTVDATGGGAKKLSSGNSLFLGWSANGKDAFMTDVEAGRVLAIEERTGAGRDVTTAEGIRSQLRAQPGPDGQVPVALSFAQYQAFALSPAGDRLALWLVADGDGGGRGAPYLAIVDAGGRLLSQGRAPAGAHPQFTTWAPGGTHLAYSYSRFGGDGTPNGPSGIQIVAVEGVGIPPARPVFAGVETDYVDRGLRWSPDGRRLAFVWVMRQRIVDVTNSTAPLTLDVSKGWPGWRPTPAR